jgi:YfiH family protein
MVSGIAPEIDSGIQTLCVPEIHETLAVVHSGRDVGNMDYRFGDQHEVDAARQRIFGMIGLKATNVAVIKPLAGTEFTDLGNQTEFDDPFPGDGLITNQPNVGLMLNAADCIPLAFYQPEQRVLALMHLGWRGIVGGLHHRMFEHMVKKYEVDFTDSVAYMGPSIQASSYVTQELTNEQRTNQRWHDFVGETSDGYHLDFPGFVKRDISEYGISDIAESDVDTGSDDSHFSYTRHKQMGVPNGRNGFVVSIK